MIMRNNEENLKQQRKRLTEVIEYLKANGIKQKEICIQADVDETALSSYKSGKIKYIPSKFLNILQKVYEINPDYIRLTSEEMLDDKGEKYLYFEKVVDEWETVDSKDNKYLYLKMDKNFYDFLLEYDNYRKANAEGISVDDKIGELKMMYAGTPDIEEFVVLPRNIFFNILSDIKKEKKCLEEIIAFSEHTSLIEEN